MIYKNYLPVQVFKVIPAADFVKRTEGFVTLERQWNHHVLNKLVKRALKYREELFTFVLVPGVDPTNNVAERALR